MYGGISRPTFFLMWSFQDNCFQVIEESQPEIKNNPIVHRLIRKVVGHVDGVCPCGQHLLVEPHKRENVDCLYPIESLYCALRCPSRFRRLQICKLFAARHHACRIRVLWCRDVSQTHFEQNWLE